MTGQSFIVYLELDPLRVGLKRIDTAPAKPGQAITTVLTIGGRLLMPAQISVDDDTQVASVHWVDDKGDTDAVAPQHAVTTFSVDDTAVATIDPASGKITPVAEGSATVSVEFSDSQTGGVLLEPDGETAFAAQPAAITVVPGQAVGVTLEVKSAST